MFAQIFVGAVSAAIVGINMNHGQADKAHGKNLRHGRVLLQGHAYLITSVTDKRRPVFEDFRSTRLLIQCFMEQEEKQSVATLAFVVMPDHFHWLMILKSPSLADVVRQVKGSSSRRINQWCGISGSLWQAGYHDHALRRDEDYCQAARYLVGNPIRAGLVENIMDYPHWDAVWA